MTDPTEMGFVVPSPTIELAFDKYPGLKVRAGSIPLGQMLDLADGADSLRQGNSQSTAARDMFKQFARNLRDWNCVRDGGMPVPADLDGLYSLDALFASEIMLAWFDAITGGDIDKGPLGPRSTNGKQSAPAPFVPTELL